jgi:DNA-binding CsgD family transcriptional regulator
MDRPALIGRASEVDALLGAGPTLLSGEAGIGKTAVLDAVAARAVEDGRRVLRAAGVQFEADFSWSGLHQLLFPLLDEFPPLGDLHGDALRTALGLGRGPAPDRLLVSNAVLLLIRRVAADHPVLMIVDDLPWIDRASAAVLGFVTRRMEGSRAGFLAAARNGPGGVLADGGLPRRTLPPLDREAAAVLLARRFPDVPPMLRLQLLHQANGNPLALMHLPAVLTRAPRGGLPGLFEERVIALPPETRAPLLLAALGGLADLPLLRGWLPGRLSPGGPTPDGPAADDPAADDPAADDPAAGGPTAGGPTAGGPTPGDCGTGDTTAGDVLDAAERAGLVTLDGGLTFRHPLIAAAVVDLATTRERRKAHAALAEILTADPERRAWHLSEAAESPDEHVAAQLTVAAHSMLRRGDAAGAVATLTRAADLTPDPSGRSRRLAEAAYLGAEAAGALDTASQLLSAAHHTDRAAGGSLHAAAATVQLLLNGDADVETAHRLLVAAIETGEHGYDAGDPALIDALHMLLLLCWFTGRAEAWPPLHAAIAKLHPAPPDLLRATAAIFGDPARTGAAEVAGLDRILDTITDDSDPGLIIRAGTAAVYAERLPRLRSANQRVIALGRTGAAPARRYVGAMMHLGLDHYLGGRWSEAADLAAEGLRACDEHGYPFFRWYFLYQAGLIKAVRGEEEHLTDELIAWASARGAHGAELFAYHPRTLAAIGRRDYESAYRNATLLTPPGVLADHVPHALWVSLDLVEAAVHTGRRAEARAHVDALQRADLDSLSPRFGLLTAGAAALVAEGDDARKLFEAAIERPGAERWPFHHARIRLAYGERLRRERAAADSRRQFTLARETFDRLGAGPWRDRAAAELRATGQTRARETVRGPAALTPQEWEIARLAGSGLTNKQIAERLFLSHRTIGDHLYRIFPKLGITTRAALRDALTGRPVI